MEEAACIAAGFFVTKPAARGASRSPDLLPPQLVSLSRCIAPSYQVFWGWDVEKHKAEAFAFGIPADRVSELHPWEKTHGITYPNVFHSLDDARVFVVAFLPAPQDVIILGAALPLALTDEFLVHHKQRVHHMQTNTYTDTCYGMNLVLTARQPLPEGGERMGFEMVLFEGHLTCSWLCTGTERDVFNALGIRPNAHGLIETYEDALRVDAWMQEHPEKAEPGPYYPWLIARYRASG